MKNVKKKIKPLPKLPGIYGVGKYLNIMVWVLVVIAPLLMFEADAPGTKAVPTMLGFGLLLFAFTLLTPSILLRDLGTNPEEFCVKNWKDCFVMPFRFWLCIVLFCFLFGTFSIGLMNMWIYIPSLIVSFVCFAIIRRERNYFHKESVLQVENR